MVKIIGRIAGELAYKVVAKGYAFEVSVAGKQFRIKHMGGGNGAPGKLQQLGGAFAEVKRFLEARGGGMVAAGFAPMFG